MNRLCAATVALLVVPTCVGCGMAGSPALPGDNDQARVQSRQEEKKTEVVQIGDQTFAVPRQWQGEKIRQPAATRSELAPLPRSLAKNGGLIYLRRDARDALRAMARRAEADSVHLLVDSGFRSSRYQKRIIARQLEQGKKFSEITRFVAPPGYSEHLTGTAVDFSPSNWRFASTPQYQWLSLHAAEFGFTETYPKNDPRHPWEPWHWRYRHPDGEQGTGDR